MSTLRPALVALVAATAFPAFASSPYPDFIQTKYGLAQKPPQDCGLCHTNGLGGATVWRMGANLKARGLTGGSNTALLGMKLDEIETEMLDTDGDGVTDVDELKAGTDPGVAAVTPTDGGTGGGTGGGGGTVEGPPALKFGCGATSVPGILFIGSALLLLGRRGRR